MPRVGTKEKGLLCARPTPGRGWPVGRCRCTWIQGVLERGAAVFPSLSYSSSSSSSGNGSNRSRRSYPRSLRGFSGMNCLSFITGRFGFFASTPTLPIYWIGPSKSKP
ncbi:hypothetical protein Taro_045487 [Colocasia esculenta]|uniref:Uncharacterized protein n=1 Tax=Colocasia esculenta TaxID=4460 RepID=A0A843WWQ5_COLES|nr:hypothetical protein [Colocasia esculenta]